MPRRHKVKLGKLLTQESLSKFHEAVQAAHKQVKEDQVTLRGDLYALECKIESKIDAIMKDLEHNKNQLLIDFLIYQITQTWV